MTRIATAEGQAAAAQGSLETVMAWTGTIAIALMAVHLVWAIVVLRRGRESELRHFHRYSLAVWAIWLIPYLAGAIGANIR